MSVILPNVRRRGHIGLYETFPAANIIVTGEFPEGTGGTLRLVGDEEAVEQLHFRLAGSFPRQGDGRYWWSAVYRAAPRELILHFEEESGQPIPILEMTTRIFCLDAVRLANLRLMHWAKLIVISQEGDRLVSQPIELPVEPNGEVIVGALS